jgi:RNA polymerase primary sigma factor
LLTDLGRNPTIEEIAVEMGISAEEAEVYRDTLRAARTIEKAKQPPKEQEPEDDQAVEDTAYFQMRQRIADLLADLSSREAQLLTMRFGLEGGKPMTPEQTAAKLGMTPEEVVAMEAAALSKLRKA